MEDDFEIVYENSENVPDFDSTSSSSADENSPFSQQKNLQEEIVNKNIANIKGEIQEAENLMNKIEITISCEGFLYQESMIKIQGFSELEKGIIVEFQGQVQKPSNTTGRKNSLKEPVYVPISQDKYKVYLKVESPDGKLLDCQPTWITSDGKRIFLLKKPILYIQYV